MSHFGIFASLAFVLEALTTQPAPPPGESRARAGAPPVTAIAFAQDGRSAVLGSQDGIEQIAWPDLARGRRLGSPMPAVNDLRFSPRGDVLAAGGGVPGEVGAVVALAWPGGETLWRMTIPGDVVHAVAWSPDGSRVACAGHDGKVMLLDASAGRPKHTLEGHSRPVYAVLFTPDGVELVSAGGDGSLRVWSASTGKLLTVLENHTGPVRALATSSRFPGSDGPGGPFIASTGDDGTVRLWQPRIGRLVRFVRLPSAPLALDWSSDGSRIVAAGKDGRLRALDPSTIDVAGDAPAIDGWAHAVLVDPSSRFALVGGEHGAIVSVQLSPAPKEKT
jgi:WD40 repeat protein